MRKRKELLEQSEFVHQFKRGGMDGIATEIAQEILMLFKHNNRNARARQQDCKHHPGGPPADDTACRSDLVHSRFRQSWRRFRPREIATAAETSITNRGSSLSFTLPCGVWSKA